MLLIVPATYFDGSQSALVDTAPPCTPLTLPREVDAAVQVWVQNPRGVPVNLAAATGQLTIKDGLYPGAVPAVNPPQPIAGVLLPKLGPNVMQFALPATLWKQTAAGLFYYDVVMLGLSAVGSRDQVVGTSALRLLPIVGSIPGT